MLNVIYAECHKYALYVKCRYAECQYAECRYSECRGTFDAPFFQTLVCNYGIGGNMMGSKVYTVGNTASACPNGSNDGLCL